MKQVFLRVVERSSTLGMALYSICRYSIHNIELDHGCFTILIVYQSILIVYQSILSSFMSYAKVLVRPDDPGTDRVCCAFGLALAFYLSIRRVGDPGTLE